MSRIGIGILGPGAIADLHAEALAGTDGVIVAAAGPDRADLEGYVARHAVPRAYATAEELLADPAVDAVIVSAPSAVHALLSTAALDAGKPVLCEVPLGLSWEDGDALVRHAEAAGLPLAVAHTTRYWEPHRRLVAELRESGRPATHVAIRSLMLRQTDTGWTGKRRSWTDSVVWHHGSHVVDVALWFLGDAPVESSIAIGEPWSNGQPMDASVQMRTGDGRIGEVALSYHARRPKADYLVVTERDTFEITGGSLFRNDEEIVSGEVATTQLAAIGAQDRAFLAAIAGDSSGLYQGVDALPTLAVLAGRANQRGD